MSPHKLRKTRKRRGTRTVGWGQVGQHRKHSQKGGRKVGRHKHLWSTVIRYEPDYFGGKKGFTSHRALKQKTNTINVGELDELVDKLAKAKQLETKEKKVFLDLEKLGYNKLLASGKITKPLVLKVAAHSENAAKKVEEAGGQIIGVASQEEAFEESEAAESGETETSAKS